jgi:2-polyprenyl-3-methyl-5-hydroxy-6-metoxy-1,4-benzoquinol methylase
MADHQDKAAGLEALTRAWLELGPNARTMLEYTARRLVIGKAHGDFDKPRDWDRETAEEEFDGAMYRAAKLLGFGTASPAANPHPEDGSDTSIMWGSIPGPGPGRASANVPHSREFFEQMKTCRDAYKRLALAFAMAIPNSVTRATVFDFGCGTGHQSAALARLGYSVVGADPLARPEDVEKTEGFEFMSIDPIAVRGPTTDVVICTEVAEHVYEERADALVAAVCMRARTRVIWSAAPPGQEWEGHVNLQPPDYWLTKFTANGFNVNPADTKALRDNMRALQAQHAGAAENFYVLDRT